MEAQPLAAIAVHACIWAQARHVLCSAVPVASPAARVERCKPAARPLPCPLFNCNRRIGGELVMRAYTPSSSDDERGYFEL